MRAFEQNCGTSVTCARGAESHPKAGAGLGSAVEAFHPLANMKGGKNDGTVANPVFEQYNLSDKEKFTGYASHHPAIG
jgi:hypothetical protein